MEDLKTITVISSRGGNSKTITSLYLAIVAAEKGIKTVLIDADLEAPSLMHLLKNFKSKYSWIDYLETEEVLVRDTINSSDIPNLDIIFTPPPKVGKSFLNWKSNSWWKNALRRSLIAKSQLEEMGYRMIIIDSQSGTSYNSLNNLVFSDLSIMVMRPAGYGLGATEGILKEIFSTLKDMNERKDFYLWTQVHQVTDEKQKNLLANFLSKWDKRLTSLGLTKLGEIPYDNQLNIHLLSDNVTLNSDELTIKLNYEEIFAKLMD